MDWVAIRTMPQSTLCSMTGGWSGSSPSTIRRLHSRGAQAVAVDRRFPSVHVLLIAGFAGLLVLSLRDWLEGEMARHMLIEFPLLLIAGAAIGRALDERFGAQIACCNQMGLVGFAFASITLAYWMIPAALDA